jgi:hypothetical protein
VTDQPLLPDGTYDVFVIDADETGETNDDIPVLHLSLTILTGERKSEVVELVADHLRWSSIDLIGMPGTLVVTDGAPVLRIDDD